MSTKKKSKRITRIIDAAEEYFGEPVVEVDAPGGSSRASYRLRFKDRNIIATLRPNFRRTHLEAYTLRAISRHCDDAPDCLGVSGEILFQSDVGGHRLNVEIARADPDRRTDLAAEAVAGIFRVQAAGRAAGLNDALPHLGQNELWLRNFVNAVSALEQFSNGHSVDVDRDDLCDRLAFPARQFVKWDCRSGNAALADDGRVRWFDFEYAGVRHGAEDLAWLIGDEAWPVAPDTMQDIVVQAFDHQSGQDLQAYLDYMALYLTFHCIQRMKLIVKEARKRGWLSKRRVRTYDDAGVHPEFAAQICRVGRFFADRHACTQPIARDFEDAELFFLSLLADGLKRASA